MIIAEAIDELPLDLPPEVRAELESAEAMLVDGWPRQSVEIVIARAESLAQKLSTCHARVTHNVAKLLRDEIGLPSST